jgi:serine/threonine protein kinase
LAGVVEGTLIGGRYRVQQLLGSGGSATIYEAEDITLGRVVALKIPHDNVRPESVPAKRLVREARASSIVNHPNVCEVSELGVLPTGTPFVVMERLRGETLRDRIGASGPMPFGDIVDIMMQVLSALGAAHERGIVHRDIKPENIFLVHRAGCPPLVKILDFGCVTDVMAPKMAPAKARPSTRPPSDDEQLTETGMVIGTPWYLAPEALRGGRDFDGRLDVYACGIILYEMATGRRPFDAVGSNELFQQILVGFPPPLSSLRPDAPRQLISVIAYAMAIDPATRYPTAAIFQRALGQVPAERATPSLAIKNIGTKLPGAPPPKPEAGLQKSPSFVEIDVALEDEWEQQTDWDQVTMKTRPKKP